MTAKEYQWLPHLESSLPKSAHGYVTTLYSIAIEGWRRGLNLKFINSKRNRANTIIELSNENKTHRFIASTGDLITNEARRACINKDRTKELLLKNNIPTPLGKAFNKNVTDDEIVKYASAKGFPLVIKPVAGVGGKGVIAGIESEKELQKSLKYVRHELGYHKIIVEEYFEGEDYRVFVVGDEVVAITKRIPANIIGDGVSTAKELISKKNKERKQSPILGASLIKRDQELHDMLKRQGYDIDSIIPKGKLIFLKSKNNISAGGDPVDITDDISDEIKQIAVNACKAIPGLPHAGVDLMVHHENKSAVVIEINSRPSLRTHLFPMKGKARDVPSKLIDYYFPETQSNHECPLYFDYGPIWDQFLKNKAQEIYIPKLPKSKLETTSFIVTGKVQHVGYARWVRRRARELGINGYVKLYKDDTEMVNIVVCASNDQINKFKNIIMNEESKHSSVTTVKEKAFKSRIKLGFFIKNSRLDRRKQKTFETKKTKRKKKKEIDYKKEYKKIINSTSWKITKPLRLISRLIKGRK